jgi:hypothetical protein
MVYFDAAHVDLAPTTAIGVSNNDTTISANWVGVAASGWSIKGFDAQYKSQSDSDWTTLQTKGQNTQASFVGQAGETYTLRARAWQRMAEPYNSDIDMPGVWQEKTITLGNAVKGQIFNHLGYPLDGVTVSVQGTATSTVSSAGSYILPTGAGTFTIVADDFNSLVAPPATTVSVPLNGLASLDISLRPGGADQVLDNNDFESDLSGWSVSDGAAAAVSMAEAHSGQGSLLISDTVEISQTQVISSLRNPRLSFWHKNEAPFSVELLAEGLTMTATRSITSSSEWTFATMQLADNGVYSGTVGLKFSYGGGPGTTIFIDEVSLSDGPYQIFAPFVLKN